MDNLKNIKTIKSVKSKTDNTFDVVKSFHMSIGQS